MLPSVSSLPLFKRANKFKSDEKQTAEESKKDSESLSIKRQRTFDSIRNQFVVHISLVLNESDIEKISPLSNGIQSIYIPLRDLRKASNSSSGENIEFEKEFHLSLIRGHYAVLYHQLEAVMNELCKIIATFNRFFIQLEDCQIFTNDEKTRHFLVICENIQNKNDEHYRLIYSIADILKRHRAGLRTPSEEDLKNFLYHISLTSSNDKKLLRQLLKEFEKEIFQPICFNAESVFIRIGHLRRSVNLLSG